MPELLERGRERLYGFLIKPAGANFFIWSGTTMSLGLVVGLTLGSGTGPFLPLHPKLGIKSELTINRAKIRCMRIILS